MSEQKEKLNTMLDAIVNNKKEEAQIAFHDYLNTKMKDRMSPEPIEPDVDEKKSADEE